jgi:hypothetical protein
MMYMGAKGRTALLDAIYLGLSQMRGAQHGRHALLIISDGGDNHSRYSERDVKRLVKECDCQLYAIGIFDPIGYRNRTPEELNGPSLLSEITEITGGRVSFAKTPQGDRSRRRNNVTGLSTCQTFQKHFGFWRGTGQKHLSFPCCSHAGRVGKSSETVLR